VDGRPDLFADPDAVVTQDLDEADSRAYEEHTVRALREVLLGLDAGLVTVDAVDLVGSRPDTLVVFRYHHRPQYVGQHPGLVAGPCAEIARLWEYAIDDEDPQRRMEGPRMLAGTIGMAFEASELTLVEPDTLAAIGRPPAVFPRLYTWAPRPSPHEQT
jgi:hypothetical protein